MREDDIHCQDNCFDTFPADVGKDLRIILGLSTPWAAGQTFVLPPYSCLPTARKPSSKIWSGAEVQHFNSGDAVA